jgi:PAS domain S-box-containing protein
MGSRGETSLSDEGMSSEDSTPPVDEGAFRAPPGDTLAICRAALAVAPHAVLVANEAGTILFANPEVDATFQYSPGEVIGQPVSRLLMASPQSDDARLWTEFWEAPQNSKLGPHPSVVGIRKDGVTVPLEIGLNVLAEGQSRYVVVSIEDVTARLDLEARFAAVTSEHLGFQRLVADIAAQFGAVEPEALDDTITDSLRQIGEALQLDRAILWRRPADEAVALATHFWVAAPEYLPIEPLPIASIPYVFSKCQAGEACWFVRVDDLPDPIDRATFQRRGPRSAAAIPLAPCGDDDGDVSALAFSSMTREQEWAPAILERLRLVAGVVSQAFARTTSHVALKKALDEIKQLRDRLNAENLELRREVRGLRSAGLVVSDSPAMTRALVQVEQVAGTPATVLLLGETGTGKEVLAQTIHNLSPRHMRQMVRVSCAAIPTALIESELFGRERGAYTGALSRQIGRFEAANQSTLFLDEIGDLPMEVQVKLLRVLQERVIERLGSNQPTKVDVRIIAATNRNLEEAVNDRTFREDLFYRINVFPIVVPPLRERIEDIPGLVWSFVDEFSRMFGKTIEFISKDNMRELQRYPWPGNVRELRNVVERAVILCAGHQLLVPTPKSAARVPQTAMTLSALEIEHIRSVLESTNWRVRGRGGAAERLGLKPTTLESRMARLGITRKRVS